MREVVCIDGPKRGRLYHFPDEVREFQVSAIKPDYGLGGMPYYVGLIYKTYYMWGCGVRVAILQRVAERGGVVYNAADWEHQLTRIA